MNTIEYSNSYKDGVYEYRHVILPKIIEEHQEKNTKNGSLRKAPHLLSESEWRMLGVQQSKGWVNYDTYIPEPNDSILNAALSINGSLFHSNIR